MRRPRGGPTRAPSKKTCAKSAISAISPLGGMRYPTQAKTRLEGRPTFSAADSPLSPVGPPAMTNQRIERRPSVGSVWTVSALNPPIELSKINVSKRFRNYCGPMRVGRVVFLGRKPRKDPWISRISCNAALARISHVRLSSRKAAFRFMAPANSAVNPGSVYTNCETAVAPEADHREAAPHNDAR